MSVYVNNLTVNIGADFTQTYDLYQTGGKVIDLTGYTAASKLRKHRDSATSVSFTVGFPDRLNGKIKISIPSWTTSRLKPGRYLYDIDVCFTQDIVGHPNEIILKLLQGRFVVSPSITRQ